MELLNITEMTLLEIGSQIQRFPKSRVQRLKLFQGAGLDGTGFLKNGG